MKKTIITCVSFLNIIAANLSIAQVQLSGYFIAHSECSAYQSFQHATNPGNINIEVNRAYEILAKNKPSATHYLIKLDASPSHRWVKTSCGEHVVPVDAYTKPQENNSEIISNDGQDEVRAVLAISWQPAFCESRPSKIECQNQTQNRFDASHFTLHGLWPQPRKNTYCNVSPVNISRDKNKKWSSLPIIEMTDETRNELSKVMPGSQSFLHRHEWFKHGTCYKGESSEKYFQDSLKLMRKINHSGSSIRKLFATNVGHEIKSSQIQNAFDDFLGDGSGKRIKISCKKDGNRNLITEIIIGLQGDLDKISMGEAVLNAPEVNVGCKKGIVDPVGSQ